MLESCCNYLPDFHLCAERPGSGKKAKLLQALQMWQLSHVKDAEYSYSTVRNSHYCHGNADEFWPAFECNLHLGQRPWDHFFKLDIHALQIRITLLLLFTLIINHHIRRTRGGRLEPRRCCGLWKRAGGVFGPGRQTDLRFASVTAFITFKYHYVYSCSHGTSSSWRMMCFEKQSCQASHWE